MALNSKYKSLSPSPLLSWQALSQLPSHSLSCIYGERRSSANGSCLWGFNCVSLVCCGIFFPLHVSEAQGEIQMETGERGGKQRKAGTEGSILKKAEAITYFATTWGQVFSLGLSSVLPELTVLLLYKVRWVFKYQLFGLDAGDLVKNLYSALKFLGWPWADHSLPSHAYFIRVAKREATGIIKHFMHGMLI